LTLAGGTGDCQWSPGRGLGWDGPHEISRFRRDVHAVGSLGFYYCSKANGIHVFILGAPIQLMGCSESTHPLVGFLLKI
jgi:hypothetical protein